MSRTEAPRQGAFDERDPPSTEGLRACVHCGICLPACPTYRVLGEEMDSPRGRIYLMRAAAEGRTPLTPTLARHLDLCLGCRACETACPSKVPFGRLLEAARGQLERRGVRSPEGDHARLGFLLEMFPQPERMAPLLPWLRFYQRSGLQRLVRACRVLGPLPRLRETEALLPTLSASGNGRLPAVTPARPGAGGTGRGRAGLLLGCVQRFFFAEVNVATVRLLATAGWEVVAPAGQGCCGAMHLHAGRLDEFRDMARRLMAEFGDDVDVVVTNAAGCGSAMKEYGQWLHDDAAAAFSRRTRDVSEVLADADLPLGALPLTVAYHDACHLAHGQGVRAQPRALLGRIPGLRLVELGDADLCCGSAGLYSMLEPGIAAELARRTLDRIRDSGARVVASGNPGCLMQIARQARAEGLPLEVVHPVTLLARALREG